MQLIESPAVNLGAAGSPQNRALIGVVKEAKHLLTQLCHVGKAPHSQKSDNATIDDACEHWLTLLECEELQPHIKQ